MVQYILIIEIDLLYGWAVLKRRPNHVNKRVVADIWFWQFLEPWHGRWYEYEIVIASCTDNIYDFENERWLLGDMIDHVGIYGSRVAEGLSASNVGLVLILLFLLLCLFFSFGFACYFSVHHFCCYMSRGTNSAGSMVWIHCWKCKVMIVIMIIIAIMIAIIKSCW